MTFELYAHDRDTAEMAKLRAEGWTWAALSERYGIAPSSIKERITRVQVQKADQSPLFEEFLLMARGLVAEGASPNDLAAAMERVARTIRRL